MAKSRDKNTGIQQRHVLNLLQASPDAISFDSIRQHFKLTASQAQESIMPALVVLKQKGVIREISPLRYEATNPMADLMIVEIVSRAKNGPIITQPVLWPVEPRPKIEIPKKYNHGYGLNPGDRVLVKVRRNGRGFKAKIVQKLLSEEPPRITGVFHKAANARPYITPTISGRTPLHVRFGVVGGPKDFYQNGDRVIIRLHPDKDQAYPVATPEQLVWHSRQSAGKLSTLALINQGIPAKIPASLERKARSIAARPFNAAGREDMNDIPFVTIDGEDTRDFDDAVAAMPDTSDDNPGGWRILAAIAEASHFVRPGSKLDLWAQQRPFSLYPPDRAVHMLGETLATVAASLTPDQRRYAVTVQIRLNSRGEVIDSRFSRAVIRSRARLTYQQVDRALDGDETAIPEELQPQIQNLYRVYLLLEHQARLRGELSIKPGKVIPVLDPDGRVLHFKREPHGTARDLIEKMMILCNIEVGQELQRRGTPFISRIHEPPSPARIAEARIKFESLGLRVPPGNDWTAADLNEIMDQAPDADARYVAEQIVFSIIKPGRYGVNKTGHFGLGLTDKAYCHSTSPVRRYIDIVVHRALFDGYTMEDLEWLIRIADQADDYEIQSKKVGRSTLYSYGLAWLHEREGTTISARIKHVSDRDITVEIGGGLPIDIPLSQMPRGHCVLTSNKMGLYHQRLQKTYRMGDYVDIGVVRSDPVLNKLDLKIDPGLHHVRTKLERSFVSAAPAQAPSGPKTRIVHGYATVRSATTTEIVLDITAPLKRTITIAPRVLSSGSIGKKQGCIYLYKTREIIRPGLQLPVSIVRDRRTGNILGIERREDTPPAPEKPRPPSRSISLEQLGTAMRLAPQDLAEEPRPRPDPELNLTPV